MGDWDNGMNHFPFLIGKFITADFHADRLFLPLVYHLFMSFSCTFGSFLLFRYTLGALALVGLAAGGGIYAFMKQKQKKKAEKEALDPDANYTEDKGDFEIPMEDESEETGEEDNTEE